MVLYVYTEVQLLTKNEGAESKIFEVVHED